MLKYDDKGTNNGGLYTNGTIVFNGNINNSVLAVCDENH